MRRQWVGSVPYLSAVAVLVAARTHAGLTQRELAARLEQPASYVGKVETGERRLDFVEFVYWARALGVDPAALMGQIGDALSKAT